MTRSPEPASAALGDFTPQARAYARSRPNYPDTLIDRLLAHCHVRAGDAVADIGAGTGLLTRSLVARGLRVTAVEPNQAMQAQGRDLTQVQWVKGTFEQTTLASAAFKWAVAAQAFHWSKPDLALPEIRRILMPGGYFTALWNNRIADDEPTLRWTTQLIRRFVPGFDEMYRHDQWNDLLTSTGDFSAVHVDEQHHVVPMSRERFIDLWRSHNQLSIRAGEANLQAIVCELAKYLDEQRIEEIPVPYLCRAWTVTCAAS